MEPGSVYRITVVPFPTSNRFCKGHRLRIDISSSNFPQFDLNPNTGEAEGRPTGRRIATNRVHCSRTHPSQVKLSSSRLVVYVSDTEKRNLQTISELGLPRRSLGAQRSSASNRRATSLEARSSKS